MLKLDTLRRLTAYEFAQKPLFAHTCKGPTSETTPAALVGCLEQSCMEMDAILIEDARTVCTLPSPGVIRV